MAGLFEQVKHTPDQEGKKLEVSWKPEWQVSEMP